MKNKFLLLILSFLFINTSSLAYVLERTNSGGKVLWMGAQPVIDIYVNPSNAQGFNETTVQNVIANSVAEWNSASGMTLRKNSTIGKNQEFLNEIFFSNDPTFFNGEFVVGVTLKKFDKNDGVIVESDIVVRDSGLSLTSTATNYLGNIITHELGHLIGIVHSQVNGSTMFYSLFRGQSQLALDDKSAAVDIYPPSNSTMKKISGKVIGGASLIGVFGAHVDAISLATGKVAASGVSDIDGTFSISGLSANDKYYLYIKPQINKEPSKYYQNVKTNFCDGGTTFRGSFFQVCGGSNIGYPTAIEIGTQNVDVGKITIGCDLDVPAEYMQKKGTTNSFEINSTVAEGLGNAFVGYFSSQEISSGSAEDKIKFNFSNITPTEWSQLSSADLYLEIKVLHQNFNSSFKANLEWDRGGSITSVTPKYQLESDGFVNINSSFKIPINKVTASENNFNVKVTPEKFTTISLLSGVPYSASDIIPDYSNFVDSMYFYLITGHIVKSNGDGTYSEVSSKKYNLTDNSLCPDGPNTYSISRYTAIGSTTQEEKKKNTVSCGTIDTGSGGGSGPMSMMLGFIISMLFIAIIKRLRQFFC